MGRRDDNFLRRDDGMQVENELEARAPLKWYVAQIKPNGFERAVINLSRQNFETFMPLQRRTVRHARQMKDVLRPVFPGYLFIRFGAEQGDWRKINSTLGVTKLVAFEGNAPTPVPNDLIDGLRLRCDIRNLLQPLGDLEPGAKVKVLAGPFSDFIGEVESLVNEDRVRLLFELMGQDTRIDLSRGVIEPL
jgi:transcriptional antiterminator RfaH